MTMSAMVDRLVEAGFDVEKVYDKYDKGYRFTISKDDHHTSAFFIYPADTSSAFCDRKQREFIDFIINEWRREHADVTYSNAGGFDVALTKRMLNSIYGKQIYISTARHSGRTAFEQAFKQYLNANNRPYIEIQKGEETMAEKNIHIRQDLFGASLLAATMQELNDRLIRQKNKLPVGIKNVIFSGPCTIVIWEDKTKTVVRCKDGDKPDYEKGLAMAIAKKAFGTNKSGSNYYDIFKKWLPKEEEE